MGSEHVAQVLPCRSELGGLGRGKGAIDPATKAHHAWLIECCPQLHFGAKLPGHTHNSDLHPHSHGYSAETAICCCASITGCLATVSDNPAHCTVLHCHCVILHLGVPLTRVETVNCIERAAYVALWDLQMSKVAHCIHAGGLCAKEKKSTRNCGRQLCTRTYLPSSLS